MKIRTFQKIDPNSFDNGNLSFSEFDPEFTIEAKVGGGALICIFFAREQDASEGIISMNLDEAIKLRDQLTKQIAWRKKAEYQYMNDSKHPWLAYAKEVKVGDEVIVYHLIETEEDEKNGWNDLKGKVIQKIHILDDDYFIGIPLFLIEMESGEKMVSRYVKPLKK